MHTGDVLVGGNSPWRIYSQCGHPRGLFVDFLLHRGAANVPFRNPEIKKIKSPISCPTVHTHDVSCVSLHVQEIELHAISNSVLRVNGFSDCILFVG